VAPGIVKNSLHLGLAYLRVSPPIVNLQEADFSDYFRALRPFSRVRSDDRYLPFQAV
jgi:hypothetical protein